MPDRYGACIPYGDPSWFTDPARPNDWLPALVICAGCPVIDQCTARTPQGNGPDDLDAPQVLGGVAPFGMPERLAQARRDDVERSELVQYVELARNGMLPLEIAQVCKVTEDRVRSVLLMFIRGKGLHYQHGRKPSRATPKIAHPG